VNVRAASVPALVAAIAFAGVEARGETHGTTRLVDHPCAGCLVSLPAAPEAAPLLVLLHGDFETAGRIYARWHAWAEERGIAVLAPTCPASEGCKGSWWQWDGDVGWLERQVDAVGALHAIDRQRVWIVGWSGGASYIGWHTQELERSFAAIVIHGGGLAPAYAACPRSKASVYFLVGDRNPLHRLAVALRSHYDQCGQDVQWSLLPGAAHEGEWSALDARRGKAILDWLATKRLESPPAAILP
jgi:poly(3-hydroxybutyrate) depolymerase